MEFARASDDDQKPVSVLEGDGICMSRILARESSFGKSSRIFYRSGEGVPFVWEMQPGTPKNPQQDEVIPPICPSPLMQCVGLPLPNLDHDVELASKMRRLREMVKKRLIDGDIIKRVTRRSKQQQSSRFSPICPSSPFSTSRRVVDVSMVDGPFCCSPWNIPAILDEENTRIFYCSQHKNAYAGEQDDLFLSRIISGASSAEQFSGAISPPAGVPFGWEMQPGLPKVSPEEELIPPPSLPPAVQSLSLPRRDGGGRDKAKKPTWKKAWIRMRRRNGVKKETKKMQKEINLRYNGKKDEKFEASLRRSDSVSSSISLLSKVGWRASRMQKNLQGRLMSCGPWSRNFLVFAGNKWKLWNSFKSS